MSEFLSVKGRVELQSAARAFASPIPAQAISNGEFMPARKSARQHDVERRIKRTAETWPSTRVYAGGAIGVRAIKHGGGTTFAQTPASALFPSMPRSAIETDCVDFTLPPHEIAQELARLAAHPYLRRAATPDPQEESAEGSSAPSEEISLRRIFRRLRAVHGVEFSEYKRSTLRRRLGRRMMPSKSENLSVYVRRVEEDPTEALALSRDFLIHVTGFFRDPGSFKGLTEHVLPAICDNRSPKERIRIWVPGCASGEEVYSIAIHPIGLPGYELAVRLREKYPHLYLVAMTGYGREEDRAAALAAGFDKHVVKPADLRELQVLLADCPFLSAGYHPCSHRELVR